jgi:hypothetical protein
MAADSETKKDAKTPTPAKPAVAKKPAAKAAVAKKPAGKAKPKAMMFASKKLSLYHPYQNVRFNPGVKTSCVPDSWLESQVSAGLIEKCK